MQLVYNGPHLEVEVPISEAASIVATRGVPVDVPAEVAKSLLSHGEGGNERPWRNASEAEPKAAAKKTGKADDPEAGDQ